MQSSKTPTIEVVVNVQDLFIPQQEAQEELVGAETWQNWFRTWLGILESHLPAAHSYELTLRLTDDLEIQSLNGQYRHLDKPTDVLAFADLEDEIMTPSVEFGEPLYLGDIVISVDTASRQAKEAHHSLITELAWLAAHGLLHLLGWDHPDDESLVAMIALQKNMLLQIGLG